MNPKTLHNLTWLPVFIIGLAALVLGIVYLVMREPWTLDQTANEALLQTSFADLLVAEVNRYLPDYLRLSYRFFGWWLVAVGALLMTYVQVTRLGTPLARNSIHAVLGIILAGVYTIIFRYIPGSPFLWLVHGLVLLYLVSLVAARGLKRYD